MSVNGRKIRPLPLSPSSSSMASLLEQIEIIDDVRVTGRKPNMTQRTECRPVRARDVGYPPMSREEKEELLGWVKTGPVLVDQDDPEGRTYQRYKKQAEFNYAAYVAHVKQSSLEGPRPRCVDGLGRTITAQKTVTDDSYHIPITKQSVFAQTIPGLTGLTFTISVFACMFL